MKRVHLLSLLLFVVTNIFASTSHWVGTWATSPMVIDGNNLPPSPGLANNSLRQIVQVSIGGEKVRLKLTNHFGNSAVEIKAVELAAAKTAGSSAEIDEKTSVNVTFNGSRSATIAKGNMLVSDEVDFVITPRQNVAITIHYGSSPSTNVSGHSGSRTTSYLASGNTTDFTSAVKTDHWYNILALETMATDDAGCVAVLGNSITDGRGSTTNEQNRWTDEFSRALLKNKSTSRLGVLNLGIGGNCVLAGGLGPTAQNRCQRDIFEQEGVKYIILFEGVNDLGGSGNGVQTARSIIEVWKQIIRQAHSKGIRVIGATVTPFKNNNYYNTDREAGRKVLNKWIMTTEMLDGAIDFATMVCDPNNNEQLNKEYLFENDWLHPNAKGYKLMGESIDLSLFCQTGPLAADDEEEEEIEGLWIEAESLQANGYGGNFRLGEDLMASGGKYLETIKDNTNESKDKADQLLAQFNIDKNDHYYIYARVQCPTWNDDSYFVSVDNGTSVMVNGLQTDSWQWKELYNGQLTKGTHKLIIVGREDGARMDKLCITTSSIAPITMGGTATAVESTAKTTECKDISFYALDGRKLSTPKHGICIVRQNNTYIKKLFQ